MVSIHWLEILGRDIEKCFLVTEDGIAFYFIKLYFINFKKQISQKVSLIYKFTLPRYQSYSKALEFKVLFIEALKLTEERQHPHNRTAWWLRCFSKSIKRTWINATKFSKENLNDRRNFQNLSEIHVYYIYPKIKNQLFIITTVLKA